VGYGSSREGERCGGDVSRGRYVGDVEDVQELLQLFAPHHLVDVRSGEVRVGLWDERVRLASVEEGGYHPGVPLLAETGGLCFVYLCVRNGLVNVRRSGWKCCNVGCGFLEFCSWQRLGG
jgi:hypothetical protein